MSQRQPIGRIEWDGRPPATLYSDLRWECENPAVAGYLNGEHTGYSPADGYPGAKLLHDAARVLKGRAVWLVPEEEMRGEPGTVY